MILGFVTWLDVMSSARLAFAIPYFACIYAAARLSAGPYAYFIAVLAALAAVAASSGFYGIYVGYPAGESTAIAVWQFITYVIVHCGVCYLFSVYLRVKLFLSPTNPLLQREHTEFTRLRQFIFRPYIHSGWTMAQRIEAIERHYRLVADSVTFLQLSNREVITLAEIPMLGSSLRITVDRPGWMRGEGELAVSLFYDIDRIYTAMIAVGGTPASVKLIVGNLQGDGRRRAELYKELTKALHGMRPRDFVVRVVQLCAGELGCTEVLGISDKAHRSAHWLTRAGKQSTYDDVWQENGGVLQDSTGFYSLPVGLRKRPDPEIPARKRALYQRRHNFMEQLRLGVHEVINAPRAGHVAQGNSHTLREGRPEARC
ncbi:MAG: hypothetical protein JWP41_548 [Ramlibacter sp.]|nr:hypothetical protein [Ramlibacter sp.]